MGSETAATREGARLGAYELGSSLGAGGMGEVYKAKDHRLGRFVAIKVLPADVATDPARRKRFEREARTVAALSSPRDPSHPASQVWMAPAVPDAGPERVIASSTTHDLWQTRLSPDGHWLAFTAEPSKPVRSSVVWVAPRAGGDWRQMTPGPGMTRPCGRRMGVPSTCSATGTGSSTSGASRLIQWRAGLGDRLSRSRGSIDPAA